MELFIPHFRVKNTERRYKEINMVNEKQHSVLLLEKKFETFYVKNNPFPV